MFNRVLTDVTDPTTGLVFQQNVYIPGITALTVYHGQSLVGTGSRARIANGARAAIGTIAGLQARTDIFNCVRTAANAGIGGGLKRWYPGKSDAAIEAIKEFGPDLLKFGQWLKDKNFITQESMQYIYPPVS